MNSPWQRLRQRIRLLNRQRLRRRQARRGHTYDAWVAEHDTLGPAECAAVEARVAALRAPPTIAVLMPVFDPPLPFLQAAIDSVKAQWYPHWQLCIADDASRDPEVVRLLEREAAAEPRIRLVRRAENGHIAHASNDALALADAPWVTLLDHDDVLRAHALALLAEAIERFPDAVLVYSDEDKLAIDGVRRDPYFKPDWNPALLLGQNYVCHLAAYRRERLLAIGGFRPGLEGAQDHDLALRATAGIAPERIVHIPHVLYHWREHERSTAGRTSAKPYAQAAAERALAEHLQRSGVEARIAPAAGAWWSVRPKPPAPPPGVTIVIPTRDGLRNLPRCLDSLHARTAYPNFEVLVVDNGSVQPEFLRFLDEAVTRGRCRVRRDDRPFNFAALNNAAVATLASEFVLLLNDDTEVLAPDWLEVMVGWGAQPGVAAVGARLWYADKTLQHGGIVLGIGDVAGHAHRHWLEREVGDHGRAVLAQDFSACTAACLLVRREAYLAAGGMDEKELAVAFNDVDFCLKLRRAGWRIVWAPEAELFHHESATRGSDREARHRARYEAEAAVMHRRWGAALARDPAYNPNLTLASEDFALARAPRVNLHRPWFEAAAAP